MESGSELLCNEISSVFKVILIEKFERINTLQNL